MINQEKHREGGGSSSCKHFAEGSEGKQKEKESLYQVPRASLDRTNTELMPANTGNYRSGHGQAMDRQGNRQANIGQGYGHHQPRLPQRAGIGQSVNREGQR